IFNYCNYNWFIYHSNSFHLDIYVQSSSSSSSLCSNYNNSISCLNNLQYINHFCILHYNFKFIQINGTYNFIKCLNGFGYYINYQRNYVITWDLLISAWKIIDINN